MERHEPAVAGAAAVIDAVDTFPEPVLIINGGCRIAGVNEAAIRLLDIDRRQLIGGRVDAWLLEDGSREPGNPRLREAVAACGAHPTRLECAARRRDGSSISVEVALSRPRCIGTEHVVASVRDLSELRALHSQLQAAKSELCSAARAHDRLLAVLGHELRTPLNAIVVYGTMMLGERHDAPLSNDINADLQMTDAFSTLVSAGSIGTPDWRASAKPALECLDRFTSAFNAANLAAMDDELNFPHVLVSGNEIIVWETAGQHPTNLFATLRNSGWAYTDYESRQVILANPSKVHVLVTYSRRDAGGVAISTHTNVWIVTCRQGKWGIALRSY